MKDTLDDNQKPLVLLVDDESTARLITSEALLNAEFDVQEAENGVEALEILDKITPDVVLTDAMMPQMDGFSLCEEIRRRPDRRLTPILMVTGLDDTASIQKAYDVGATDFITKPFDWLVLTQRVRHIIRESRLVEHLRQSEAKNRALLSAMPDMMLSLDDKGTILDFKTSKDFSLMYIGPQSIGKDLYGLMPINVAQNISQATRNVLTNGGMELIEYQIADEKGIRHFEARIVKCDENKVLSIMRDITKRKESEKALRDSEERYALAIRGANDGLWDWDLKSNEVHYSPRWKTMLGWKETEIGCSPEEWFSRIHSEDLSTSNVSAIAKTFQLKVLYF